MLLDDKILFYKVFFFKWHIKGEVFVSYLVEVLVRVLLFRWEKYLLLEENRPQDKHIRVNKMYTINKQNKITQPHL